MIKQYFKPLNEREANICNFNGCQEPYACFYKGKPVCSLHYFELRRIISAKLGVKAQEKTNA